MYCWVPVWCRHVSRPKGWIANKILKWYFTRFGFSDIGVPWLSSIQRKCIPLERVMLCVSCSPNEPRHDKTNKMSVRPAKTQISLGIRPVWSESSLCAQRVPKDPKFLHADSEDSDQTGRMPRLIWVFAGRTCHFVGFVTRRLKWYQHFNLTQEHCSSE